MRRLRPPIHYLNTDLDLASQEDLLPLVRALERAGMYRLHVERSKSGPSWAWLESGKNSRTVEGHIKAMLKVIENLKPAARRIWDRCDKRELHPGFDSGFRPTHGRFSHGLSAQTLARMVNLSLSFRITIYPPDEEGPPPDPSARAQRP